MAWLRVDDGFYDHRKVDETPLSALGLWVKCGAYTARQLDDGHLSARTVRKLDGRLRDINALVGVGLWVPTPGGYVMHDYLQWNPSGEQVKAKRAAGAERFRRWYHQQDAERRA